MRLKTFTAESTAKAMELVRTTMGEDAIIVSSQPNADGKGVRVTAAIEEEAATAAPIGEEADDAPSTAPEEVAEEIRQALVFHGVPPRLIERLIKAAVAHRGVPALTALTRAIDTRFDFRPLELPGPGERMLLVGPPGAGKTLTVAKIAARATLERKPIAVASTDTKRAGGIEQLEAFTRILQLPLKSAAGPEALTRILGEVGRQTGAVVDTAGVNPFSNGEMSELEALIEAAGAEPVLVLPAGGDALETADMAAALSALGCRRLLVTRLDLVRRMGSLLAAADAGRLAFAGVSINPNVADGLNPLNPTALARLLMPQAAKAAGSSRSTQPATENASS